MTSPHTLALPPLYEALLSDAQLEALFTDVGTSGGPVEVSWKAAAMRAADDAAPSLSEALAALQASSVRGVQLRYAHDGALWCDTLIRLTAGVRLVRCALPVADRREP